MTLSYVNIQELRYSQRNGNGQKSCDHLPNFEEIIGSSVIEIHEEGNKSTFRLELKNFKKLFGSDRNDVFRLQI